MRRALVFILLVSLVFTSAAGNAQAWAFDAQSAGTPLYVVNCEEFVTLRAQPDTQAEALAQIPLGAQVVGYGDVENGFCQVEYQGVLGYVLSDYLSWAQPEPAQERQVKYVVRCQEYVTLRAQPDTSAASLAHVPLGAQVDSYGAEGSFARVSYAGMQGYILSEYLSDTPESFGARLGSDPGYNRLSTAQIEAYASSEQIDQYGYYSAANANDADPSTAWCEGVNGAGEGEWLSLFFDEHLVAGFAVHAGYQRSDEAYKQHARPAQIAVSVASGETCSVKLEDAQGEQIVLFDRPVYTDYLSIEIESSYGSATCSETFISDVRVLLAG